MLRQVHYKESALETPNDPKLSDSGPEAPGESTAARGEGAACAGLGGGAHAVTEPDKLGAGDDKLNAKAAVRCSAWLGVAPVGIGDVGCK